MQTREGTSEFSGGPSRATILDPKTHVLLRAFTEVLEPDMRQATGQRNSATAMGSLVNDIRILDDQPACN